MRYQLVVLAALPWLSGCVFSDIRDQVVVANTGLAKVDTQLAETNNRLTDVEKGLARLDRTNDLIGNVESGLGRIDRTNNSLGLLEHQLNTLDSMNKSMVHLDQHLAGLRKSLNRIDSLLPFMDIGSGDVTDPQAASPAPAQTPVAAGDPKPDATTNDPAAVGEAPKSRPDPLVGIWIAEYPQHDRAFVLLANGTFVRAVTNQPLSRGTWKKVGEEYIFTSESPATTNPDGTKTAAAATVARLKMLSIMGRTASFEVDGAMVIYSRR